MEINSMESATYDEVILKHTSNVVATQELIAIKSKESIFIDYIDITKTYIQETKMRWRYYQVPSLKNKLQHHVVGYNRVCWLQQGMLVTQGYVGYNRVCW